MEITLNVSRETFNDTTRVLLVCNINAFCQSSVSFFESLITTDKANEYSQYYVTTVLFCS